MKNHKTSLIMILWTFHAIASCFATGTWNISTKTNDIQSISVQGNYIWCNTTGGVVRWDRRDSTYVKYTTRDGLYNAKTGTAYLDASYLDIIADSYGNVWVGKNDHVLKYDGMVWKHVLQANPISMMLQDNNTLWMSQKGSSIVRSDGDFWQWYEQEREHSVNCMAMDRTGVMWLGCFFWSSKDPDGVRSWKDSTYFHYTVADGLLDNTVGGIYIDSDNAKWFRTAKGLSRFDGKTWKNYPVEPDTSAILWGSLVRSKDGAFWTLGSGGIYRFDGSKWDIYEAPIDPKIYWTNKAYPTKLEIDADGVLWYGTSNGLIRFDGHSWCNWREPDGPFSNGFNAIFVDSRNVKWFLNNEKISTFDGLKWSFFPGSMMGNSRIVEDRNGTLWFLTPNSNLNVRCFDGEDFISYPIKGDDIAVDSADAKWFINSNGLYRFVGSEWQKETGYQTYVYNLTIDHDDVKWIGCNGKIMRYDGETLKTYTDSDGLSTIKGIIPIRVDENNGKWCISGNRLMNFDGERWIDRTTDIPGATIAGFPEDRTDMEWVNTDTGLWHYQGSSWTQPISKDSLQDTVSKILKDPDGTIWLISSSRLYRWNGSEIKLYSRRDGLATDQVNTMAIDKDGVKWFGGIITSLKEDAPVSVNSSSDHPESFALLGNRPNPFNPATTITFILPKSGKVTLSVYSITGQKVRELVSEFRSAGRHSVVWNGRDNSGNLVSSGLYISRLESGGKVNSAKMLMMK